MSLFRAARKTYVSSVVYNLGGDEYEDFMKKTVFEQIYKNNGDSSLAQGIVSSITGSRGFNLRHYLYWLQNTEKGQRYNELIGYEKSEVQIQNTLDKTNLAKILKNNSTTQCCDIAEAKIDWEDITWWGARYISLEYPEYLNYEFIAEYEFRDENGNINPHELSVDVKIPNPTQENPDAVEIVPLERITLPYTHSQTGEVIPDYKFNTKYLYCNYQLYNCTDTDNNNIYDGYDEFVIQHPDYNFIPNEIKEHLHAKDTDPVHILIYEQGSGINGELERLFTDVKDYQASSLFVPPIPFRINNKQVYERAENGEELYQELLPLCKHAVRRIFSSPQAYKNLNNGILKNDDLGKIDYTYLVFGTALNTKDWAGKEYIYEFFKQLYLIYFSNESPADQNLLPWQKMQTKELYVKSTGIGFSYSISWDLMEMSLGEDLPSWFEKTSKRDTVCLHRDSEAVEIPNPNYGDASDPKTITRNFEYVYIAKQISDTKCDILKITGLTHKNYVYGGKSVHTSGYEALKPPKKYRDEETGKMVEEAHEDSGFIVPIHEGIFKSLPTVAQAQMGQYFAYLVFNCYEQHKKKWYQTKSFSGILIAAIIIWNAINLYRGGAQETWGSSAMAISMQAAGYSASTAAVVAAVYAAVASSIAAFVVSQVVMKMLEPVLGKKWAAIFGAIAGMIAGAYTGGLMASANPSQYSFSISSLFSNSMQFANFCLKTLDGYAKGLNLETQEKIEQGKQKIEELQDKVKQTQALTTELNAETNDWARERVLNHILCQMDPETFLATSNLTATDFIEASFDIIDNFAEHQLYLKQS